MSHFKSDGGGNPNLMEYALGLNPLAADQPNSSNIPQTSLVTGTDGSQQLSIFYRQAPSAGDLTYSVEVSGDLSQWTHQTVTDSITMLTDGTELVQAHDAVSLSGTNRRFIRLNVTNP